VPLNFATCGPQFGAGTGGVDVRAGFGIGHMLMFGHAGRDEQVTGRAARLGFAVCATLVALAAMAQQAGAEPQLNVVSPPSQAPVASPPADPPAAQPPGAVPPAAAPPATAPPNAGYQPGFIDAFGRLIGESAAKLNSQIKSTNETLGNLGNKTTDAAKDAIGTAKDAIGTAKDAVGTAKDAAGALVGLPSARIVTGRERCAAAANGAPDCRAAADAACRGKGFASGKILDTQSAQKCPARVWLSGRFPAEGDCQLETFVTRAVCQ
jgi:hypothetical protein